MIQHEGGGGPLHAHRSQSWPSLRGGAHQGGGSTRWPQQHKQAAWQGQGPGTGAWGSQPEGGVARVRAERQKLVTRARSAGGGEGAALTDLELGWLGWSREELGIATGHRPEEWVWAGRDPAGGVQQQEDPANDEEDEEDEEGRMQDALSGAHAGIARHPLTLRSAYVAATGFEPSFTSCHNRYKGTLDYIWFGSAGGGGDGGKEGSQGSDGNGGGGGGEGLRLTAVLLPPPARDVEAPPNCEVPSDHIPLVADFVLKGSA